MAYFMMKALTLDNEWYEFTINDIPSLFTDELFVLLTKPNTPHLQLKTIRRGDPETRLYEGDVIEMEGRQWLVCYERGFYVINTDYVSRHLYTLTDYKVVGTNLTSKIDINITFKEKHLFKYGTFIFSIKDIVGAYEDKCILRFSNKPVPPSEINQECCCSYNGTKVFLNDKIDGGYIDLYGGRITLHKDNDYVDITTGGIINGYHS